MAYYETNDHRQTTDNQPLTHQQVLHRFTDHQPPTHQQVLHWPPRIPTTDPLTSAPQTHQQPTPDHRPTDMCSTNPPTTDHQPTDRSSTDPPIINPLTHRPFYNWPTTLWLTNLILTETPLDQFFQQLISIHHLKWVPFITELVKLFIKWFIKKNVDKLQILFIIPFGNWYHRIGIWNEEIGGAYHFSKCFLLKNLFLFL